MRSYTVRPGDTPARIAARDDMAGCPKCSIDLIRANPHKPTVVHRNGFVTFRELRAGEKLRLPEKWFNGELDLLPKSYFKALPHYDGVTGLGDFPTLDQATTQLSVLDTLDDAQFHESAPVVADGIDRSVSEVGTTTAAASATFAKDTHTETTWARQRNKDLGDALARGDKPGASAARYDVRNALTTAIGSARLSLQSFYGGPGPTPIAAASTTKKTVSTAGMVGIGVLGAAAIGATYLAVRRKPRR